MYISPGPSREEVDTTKGLLVLEFGANWCGYCNGAQSIISEALTNIPNIKDHIKVEDGPGRKLGRSFRVKLWPTLILIHDGVEIARVARPQTAKEITNLFGGTASN